MLKKIFNTLDLPCSLPEPYGELAAVAPVAQLIITGWPLWIIFFALRIHQKCCKADNKDTKEREMKEYSLIEAVNNEPTKE